MGTIAIVALLVLLAVVVVGAGLFLWMMSLRDYSK